MSKPDPLHLIRVLQGQRFRAGERRWVVARPAIEGDRLRLEFEGADSGSLELELPRSFDSHSSEHMAWLLGQIEGQLKARSA